MSERVFGRLRWHPGGEIATSPVPRPTPTDHRALERILERFPWSTDMDYEPTAAEAALLSFMLTNTKRKTGNFTATWEDAATTLGRTRAEVKADAEALEEAGLVERHGANTWAVTEAGRLTGARARDNSDSPSGDTPSTPSAPLSLRRFERTPLVKSSYGSSDPSLHSSEDEKERLKRLAQEASDKGRIKRKVQFTPEKNPLHLVWWFRNEVAKVLAKMGVTMVDPVPEGAAVARVKAWSKEVPLADIKVAMEVFLGRPTWASNWVVAAKQDGKEPWWSFYNERNVYLQRSQGVSSKSAQGDGRLSEGSLSKWGLTADDLAAVEDHHVVRPSDEGQE